MPVINPPLPADGDEAIVEPYNAAIQAILGVLNGSVDADNIAAGAIGLSELSTVIQGFLVPTASILSFGGTSAPTGWLMCDGSSQLRANYSALFAAIGTAYGSVDGTHFNLPDFRGRVPVGREAMGGTTSGRLERTSTLTTVSGSPSATVGSATGLAPGMFITNANVTAGTKILSISGTTITMSANATGNGTTVTARFSMLGNDPEVLGAAGGEDVHQLVTNELAAHSHTQSIWNSVGSFSNGTTGLHSQGGTSTATTVGTSENTNNTGSDQAHNNMQPSLVTNFIIKT